MKYLNNHKSLLLNGAAIPYRGKMYWANLYSMEVYAMSIDAWKTGVINGYKVADIAEDGQIIKA